MGFIEWVVEIGSTGSEALAPFHAPIQIRRTCIHPLPLSLAVPTKQQQYRTRLAAKERGEPLLRATGTVHKLVDNRLAALDAWGSSQQSISIRGYRNLQPWTDGH